MDSIANEEGKMDSSSSLVFSSSKVKSGGISVCGITVTFGGLQLDRLQQRCIGKVGVSGLAALAFFRFRSCIFMVIEVIVSFQLQAHSGKIFCLVELPISFDL